MPDQHTLTGPPARRRWLSLGMISFLLLAVNTAGVFWALWMVGGGVDSGIGFFYYLSGVTFPLFLVTLTCSVTSVIRKKGRIPGTVTTVISLGVLAWAVYSFLDSQVF
ncbi:hypothetical protein [Arthrobacter sp. SLBN-100]|uniref:hypothetical protein n=1 Tax=Arthrobacter sp. SLBN-100 TaxID=2768450 RepID=UPI001151D8B9|nr:hypothetical protein [Arthrobacter sp. SLBN-100]